MSLNEGLSLVIMQTIAASLELRFQYLIALPRWFTNQAKMSGIIKFDTVDSQHNTENIVLFIQIRERV